MALGCGGLQLEKWRSENTVQMHPGQSERWLLRLPLAKDDGDTWERDTVNEAVTSLFREWQKLFRTTEPEVLEFASSPAQLAFLPVQRAPQLDINPTQRPAVFAVVGFDYRGKPARVPWPTFRQTRKPDPGASKRFDPLCPIRVDAFLVAAGEPAEAMGGEVLAPPDRQVEPGSGFPGLPDMSGTFRTAAKVVLWGGAAVILWQLYSAAQDVRGRLRG